MILEIICELTSIDNTSSATGEQVLMRVRRVEAKGVPNAKLDSYKENKDLDAVRLYKPMATLIKNQNTPEMQNYKFLVKKTAGIADPATHLNNI